MWNNFDDIFKEFFGDQNGMQGEDRNKEKLHDLGDLFDDLWRDGDIENENSPIREGPTIFGSHYNDDFPNRSFGFGSFGSPGQMMQLMDEIFKSFGGGSVRIGDEPFGTPSTSRPPQILSPRDQMLKQPEKSLIRALNEEKTDRDLDKEITKDNIERILPVENIPTRDSGAFPQSYGHFQVYSSLTKKLADGSVEHKETMRDSQGAEKTLVQRTDQRGETSVTETWRDPATGQLQHRTLTSPSDSALQGRRKPAADDQALLPIWDSSATVPKSLGEDQITQSLFQKFFGRFLSKNDTGEKSKL